MKIERKDPGVLLCDPAGIGTDEEGRTVRVVACETSRGTVWTVAVETDDGVECLHDAASPGAAIRWAEANL